MGKLSRRACRASIRKRTRAQRIKDGELKVGSLIRLDRYLINQIQGKSIVRGRRAFLVLEYSQVLVLLGPL